MNDNKLIAEFMDMQDYQEMGEYVTPPFHTSWDWLMPVVEKIESMNYIVEIITHKTEISKKKEYPNKSKVMMASGEKINTTYQAVIEFIKEKQNG
jgi:hypothetical protein